MAERSQIFASEDGDRTYSAAVYSEQLYNLARNGYVNGKDDELEVVANDPVDLSVDVSLGAAWVEGRYYEIYDTVENVALETPIPSGTNRIDRIVVRLNKTSEEITVDILTGTEDPSPVAPSLTRTDTIWELSLAQIFVYSDMPYVTNADITDEREDTTLCGISTHSNLGGIYEGDYLKATYNESGLTRLQNKMTDLAVQYDTGSWVNTGGAADTVTVDRNGIYLIQCRLYLDPNTDFADQHEGRLYVYKNGSAEEYWIQLFDIAKTSPDYEDIRQYDQTIGAAVIYYLEEGDTLSFYSYYDTADSLGGGTFDDTYEADANIEIYHLLETTLT